MSNAAPSPTRTAMAFAVMAVAIVVLFAMCLLAGSVDIPAREVWDALAGTDGVRPAWRIIVVESRLPQALTAMIAGASLAVAGLEMQTAFDNPLAGPSILGVSSGASLGVAIVMLALGGTLGALGGSLAAIAGAVAGAVAVIGVLLAMSRIVRSAAMLLIAGILVGYLTSAVISILNFFATATGVQTYMVWGLGTFSATGFDRLPWLAIPSMIFLAASLLLVKPMDALLLGERYAASMGVSVRRVRGSLLAVSGLLTAFVTAFCGPIGFIGLAVPHIARFVTATSSHRVLLPATMLCGAATGLLCSYLTSAFPAAGVLPVNAVTPLVGVPVILYIILRRRHLHYFN